MELSSSHTAKYYPGVAFVNFYSKTVRVASKGKAIPLQAWTGP
jgi:hypothetical protein